MRLKQIKLAGFKSFVDPTTVEFPSALVGVAGPNGSGKSNIIDAVRWVMGESSAKHIRGGQMADVIFNGSGGRQPLATAAVEMTFDNSAGRLGGEYAGWREIAIRRSVDREGVSSYYLNGTRCRRRDVTDVFLGTGLGPRSYAIIEQGTIGRLVESRPEELRDFLEEAAGISRYKERRRETENRMGHTRENLDRVDDLLEEVDKRLSHLRRQARAAERYKEYKAEERRLRAELLALRIRAVEAELGVREKDASERGLAVEAEVTREREIERDLAAVRSEHDDALGEANRIQQRYFDLQTEIARLEENIAGAKRERELRSERLQTIGARLEENERRASEDEEGAAEWSRETERLAPALEAGEARAADARSAREEAEDCVNDRLESDSAAREILAEARRALAVAEAGMRAAEEREGQLARRGERLREERAGIAEQAFAAAGDAAREKAAALRREAKQAEGAAGEAETAVSEARQRLRAGDEKITDIHREQAGNEARLDALEAMARAGRGGEETGRWLAEHQLRDRRRLAAVLAIGAGWESAVELVLGEWLELLEVEATSDGLAIALTELGAGRLGFVERGEAPAASPGTLAEQVRGPFPDLIARLNRVRTADSTEDALRRRATLGPGESVITRDGLWCARGWIRIFRPTSETDRGAIEREQEHRELETRRERLAGALDEAQAVRAAAEARLDEAEERYAQAREAARTARDALAEGLTREAQAGERSSSAQTRAQQLEADMDEIAGQIEQAGEERERLFSSAEASRGECSRLEAEREPLAAALSEARERFAAARADYEAEHEAREALALKLESARVQARAAADATRRLREEREALAVERGRLQARLAEMSAPDEALQNELESRLDAHREVNETLAAARDRAAGIEARVTELERARHSASNCANELREGLDTARLAAQELKTRRESLGEQLDELDVNLALTLAEMEESAEAGEWERRLDAVGQRIQRLGAINLTAIDECAAEAEREDYLKHQREDLAEAMATLEDAIGKIDRETRARFKETFDHVNRRLGELFQRLFGGGTAALVLTSEELLDAGVVITARPPGKKNATIQMLSGGEKALVAVALVFAIFELNPAPFCLLDEVDAPMDDANVERFCELVRELAANTQFVLITHNRHTMALCHQLIGITMQEPGVSRLVGVDVDEAERLAVG